MNSNNETDTARRTRKDILVKGVVTAFGGLVLLTLVVLIAHLIMQALPLALSPTFHQQSIPGLPLSEQQSVIAAGDVLEGQSVLIRSSACSLSALMLSDRHYEVAGRFHRPCNHEVKAVTSLGRQYVVDVSPAGLVRVQPVSQLHTTSTSRLVTGAYGDTLSTSQTQGGTVSFAIAETVWSARENWQLLLSSHWAVAVVTTPQQTHVQWVNRQQPTQVRHQQFASSVKVLPLPESRHTATVTDQTISFHAMDSDSVSSHSLTSPVTWWQSLEKDRTVFVANQRGELTRWTLRSEDGKMQFGPTYRLSGPSVADPLAIKDHASANAVALLTRDGGIALLNRITGEVVSQHSLKPGYTDINWYGNRLYATGRRLLAAWNVEHISGVTTWSSLFEPQQYEGYPTSETVWQTTNASDYLEAKYSITPMLIGSMKASLLALFVAIPIAVCAAVYTAFFARSRLRHVLKPAIEMLEAVPSVLIGFIAAIWLAPVAGQFLFSFAFFIVTVPFLLLAVALVQNRMSTKLPAFMRHSSELLFSLLGIFILGYISVEWAPMWLEALLGGQATIEQLAENAQSPIGKNTLVVAIALGIAISPSIYSLTEDAISGVPDSLKHASYALGATRLQTLMHVVLHVATPGILAAVMLGFGRAFGETMIVLMATGNTPVASWSLFEGLRALTANLAIELPEADVDSAHYHILFLTACILFGFTFVVNTFAEFLRRRLRKNAYNG